MFNVIKKEQFEEVMNSLKERIVNLKLYSETINVSVEYDDFMFDKFKNGRYKFDNLEDNTHAILIDAEQIEEIHRDDMMPTMNSEEIILYMKDGTEIVIWSEY